MTGVLILFVLLALALVVGIVFARRSTSSIGTSAPGATPITPPGTGTSPSGGTPPVITGVTLRTPPPTDVAVFDFVLQDNESDLVQLEVEFSIDQGANWSSATEASIAGTHGVGNLTSSPAGERHVFAWDAAANLPAGTFPDVRLRFRPHDTAPGQYAQSQSFALTVTNQRPSLFITEPRPGQYTSPIEVVYTLIDLDSDLIDIDVAFSLDGGNTFAPATEEPQGSDGTTRLASTPIGVIHRYMWNAGLDTGGQGATGVIVSITPRDRAAGIEMQSAPIDVLATSVPGSGTVLPPSPTFPPIHPNPGPPLLQLFQPYTGRGPVTIASLVGSDLNEPVDMTLEYSIDQGASWSTCSMTADSDALDALPASSHVVDYNHVWDTLADLGANAQETAIVRSKVTETRSGRTSPTAQTAGFSVDTRPEPALPVNHDAPVTPLSIAIEEGDGQTVMAGFLGRETLKVRVRDRSGQPLAGARVHFAIANASTSMNATLEPDPRVPTTTGADGIAGIRFRVAKSVQGALVIKAGVEGVPAASILFNHTVTRPRIVIDPNSVRQTLEYGEDYDLTFYVDGDADLDTVDYLAEARRPRRFKVEATRADISDPRLLFHSVQTSTSRGTRFGANRLRIAPNTRPGATTGTINLKVSDPNDPFVLPYDENFTIGTAPHPQRLVGYRPTRRADWPAYLVPASGFDPTTGKEQHGYPGLTLATPFRVNLTNGSQNLTQRVSANFYGCVTPVLERLEVTWHATNGVVSTNVGVPGTGSSITVGIDVPVFFTPTRHGPWGLKVFLQARVHDAQPRTFTWVDSHGTGHCYRENGVYVSTHYTFLIQPPDAVELVEQGISTGLRSVAQGMFARLRVSGLSLFRETGQTEPLELESTMADGSRAPTWTGLPARWKQDIPLIRASASEIQSAPILLIGGNPLPTPTTAHLHQVLPYGWLQALAPGIHIAFPVEGRSMKRRVVGPVPTLQESATLTSPTEGYDQSVYPLSGELIRFTTDLSFQSRPGSLAISRAYRSMLDEGGIFGPGWHAIYEARVDLAQAWGTRVLDHFGRLDDFVDGETPRGLFQELRFSSVVSADTGVAFLYGPQRDEIHFNADGTLRLHKDRMENITRFAYDKDGRLARIEDPLGRTTAISYYTSSDPVPPEVRGKVKKIVDFAGRVVDYAYYTDPADPDGPVGHLKSVRWAKAATRIGSRDEPAYQRGEDYHYYKTTDAKKGALKELRDSEGTVLLKVEYDALRRVEKQENALGVWGFEYPQGQPVKVTDADGNERLYTQTISPLADAATASQVTIKANRGVRPGGSDTTTVFRHNHDANVVAITHPGGFEEHFVYEDDATSPRRRNNLLVQRIKGANGDERVSSWVYSNRYNLPLSYFPPESHLPGASRNEYETYYTYDYMVNAGNFGNLVKVVKPRQVNGVMVVNAAGNDEQRWIHSNPTLEFRYNGVGLVIWAKDEQGVVTTYTYYTEANPHGGPGVAASAVGGGFLAAATRDAEVTPDRDRYFPAQPLEPISTEATYHVVGDLESFSDRQGVTHKYTVNDLRQLTHYEAGSSVRSGAPAAPSMNEDFIYGHQSMLVERKLLQPGAPPEAGGSAVKTSCIRDDLGRIIEERAELGNNETAVMKYGLNAFGAAIHVSTPNAESGDSPDELIDVVLDEKHRPYQLHLGRSAAAGAGGSTTRFRTITFDVNDQDIVTNIDPSTGPTTAIFDGFGALRGASASNDLQTRSVADGVGHPVGTIEENPGTIYGFTEIRRRKDGVMTRFHNGLVATDPLNPGGPTFPITERKDGFPGMTSRTPPASTSLLLDEGTLSPGDGRHMYDLMRDAKGRVSRVVRDDNHRMWFRYNAHGEAVAAGDGARSMKFVRDGHGNMREITVVETSTDPTFPGQIELKDRFDSDGYGRPVRIVDGMGNATRVEFDQSQHVMIMTDANGPDSNERFNGFAVNLPGNERTIRTDGANRVRLVTAKLTENGQGGGTPEINPYNTAAKTEIGFRLNKGGSITGLADSSGTIIYGYVYDSKGRLRRVIHPPSQAASGGSTTTFTYDSKGRPETVTDPNGTRVRLSYDAKNRVSEIRMEAQGHGLHMNGPDRFSIVYDKKNRPLTMWHSPQRPRIELRYDSDNNVREHYQTWGATTIGWVGPGKRKGIEYLSGDVVSYFYDWEDRVRWISLNGNLLVQINYIGKHAVRTMKWDFPGAATRNHNMKITYDTAGRVTKIEYSGFAGGTLTFDLVPDRMGRFKSWKRTYGQVVEERVWDRDSVGRIRSETSTFSGGRQPERVFTRRWFDADSTIRKIRVEETRTGSTSTSERVFEREERGRIYREGSDTFTYDANGNLKADDVMRYEYDWLDRLTRVRHPASGQTSEFFYDQLGRRYKAMHGTTEERFLYDGWQLIEVRDATSTKERYYWGPGTDQLIACQIGSTFYNVFLAPDGSVDSLVDDQGQVVQTYDYDLFGKRTVLDANRAVTGGQALCRIGFHGKVQDDRNELIDFRVRWFSSRRGFFLTPDPGGMVPTGNAYCLAYHDPITLSDPWGLGDDDIDWWEAGTSFATTLFIGVVFIGAAALAVGAGIVAAPIVLVGGLALLAGAAAAHGITRWSEGQSVGESAVGGVLDTVGISQFVQGGWSYDVATMSRLKLTGQQRGQLLGGGLGLMATFALGGRVIKGFHARGVKIRMAREQGHGMLLKASGNPKDVVWNEQTNYVGSERYTSLHDSTPAGRPRTLADFMDAMSARLVSYPKRGIPFREAQVVRFSSMTQSGRYRGSDFVFITRRGQGELAGIPNAHTDRAFSWLSPSQLAKYPQVRLAQASHNHPPSAQSGGPLPGFSNGNSYRPTDPLYLGEDLLGLEMHMNHGPWANRHAPTLEPFVLRIAESGAIEEFAYIVPRAMSPRHPRPFWIEDPIGADVPSLLLPNIPQRFP